MWKLTLGLSMFRSFLVVDWGKILSLSVYNNTQPTRRMSRHPIFHSESSNVMTSTPVHLMSRTPPPQNNCNCRGVYAAAIDPLPLQLHLPRSTWQTSSNRITAPPQLIKKATMQINKLYYFEILWISNPIFIKINGAIIPSIRVNLHTYTPISSLSLSLIYIFQTNYSD